MDRSSVSFSKIIVTIIFAILCTLTLSEHQAVFICHHINGAGVTQSVIARSVERELEATVRSSVTVQRLVELCSVLVV